MDRLLRRGARALTDAEILALVLGTDTDETAIEHAADRLEDAGGFAGLLDDEASRLDPADRARLLAAREISVRIARDEIDDRDVIARPWRYASYLLQRFAVPDQEVFGAVFLDDRYRMLEACEIFRGTLGQASVEPRQIFRRALVLRSPRFFVFHTHPVADAQPSRNDIDFTRRLVAAADLLGLVLVDHLILGIGGDWISLRDRGIVPR